MNHYLFVGDELTHVAPSLELLMGAIGHLTGQGYTVVVKSKSFPNGIEFYGKRI